MVGSGKLRAASSQRKARLFLLVARSLPLKAALRAVALLEFLLAAARARVVAANVLQGVAHRLLVAVVAVRAVHMAVVVMMVVTVVAVGAMDMGLLGHCGITPV
jgi:hypothetical protein